MTKSTVSEDAVVVECMFDAAVDLVWQLWTHPEHFKKWYGPKGFTVSVAEMDVRVGGKRLVCMEMQKPDGSMKMWTTGEYTEVIPNQRLVYTESMADEQGNVVTTSDGEHPTTTEVTVLLEDHDGRTKMVLTHVGVPAGAGGGWEQAFAKMTDYIEFVVKMS